MTDNPLDWPLDVFWATLDDLDSFAAEKLNPSIASRRKMHEYGESESRRRRLISRGIPEAFIP